MVSIEKVNSKDLVKLKDMLIKHTEVTKSKRGAMLLENFEDIKNEFVKIIPKEISKLLQSKGINIDDFDFVNPNLD